MTSKPSRPLEPPFTYALHDEACQKAAQSRQILVQYVLAQRGPIVYCATLKHRYSVPHGPDCWTLETIWPEKARITVACKNVIACAFQRCSCAAEREAATGGSVAGRGGFPLPLSAVGAVTCL